MTVAELIEKLEAFPPNAKITVSKNSEWVVAQEASLLIGVDMGDWISSPYPGQAISAPRVTVVTIF